MKKKKTKTTPADQDTGHRDISTKKKGEEIRHAVLSNLLLRLGKVPHTATPHDWYVSLAYTVRDRMIDQWIRTLQNFTEDMTVVSYLSAEFHTGPQLGSTLNNLGIYREVDQAMKELGLNLKEITYQEKIPGLGDSGFGILAASAMDSLSTLGIPAIGYGIRYEFGVFDQDIRDGWQVEMTDKWLCQGNPWEIIRPEITYNVNVGGRTESYYDEQDCFRVRWIPKFSVKGIAYDTPVSGYRASTTNLYRLWKSEAAASFELEAFSTGDYFSALNEKVASESLCKVLYPHDEPYAGKHLRLAQQYFFVSCSLQDMIRLHLLRWKSINTFSNSFAVHLNDTSAAIAVAELMRLLVDDHLVNWDKAWYITQNTFSYTSYTVLSESLEKWPLSLFAGILPRHLDIIYEINRRFLDEICLKFPDNNEKISRLSLIDESEQKYVRMGHLACLGCHSVNGVTETQSALLKNTIEPDICELYPERFRNVSGGVSPRRWIVLSNEGLAGLLSSVIGDLWISNLEELKRIEPFAENPEFLRKWQQVKHINKTRLAQVVLDRTGVKVDTDTLFDVQVSHVHEFRRQCLNLLHIITRYQRIKQQKPENTVPRTFIFGGKSSPGNSITNLIIKLICSVAEVVNGDPEVAGKIMVVFLPDFNIRTAESVYPAADLSEQISITGRDVPGSSSLKFALNGALTIGTPGGMNTEISKEVGIENFFLFGMDADEVRQRKDQGYNPMEIYRGDQELKEVIDLINSGLFSKNDLPLFKPLVDSLLCRDEYMILADYRSYVECQERAGMAFSEKEKWTKMSVLTVARMGRFSSDRVVREYNEQIWHASPLKAESEEI